jgi:hypothetical protein
MVSPSHQRRVRSTWKNKLLSGCSTTTLFPKSSATITKMVTFKFSSLPLRHFWLVSKPSGFATDLRNNIHTTVSHGTPYLCLYLPEHHGRRKRSCASRKVLSKYCNMLNLNPSAISFKSQTTKARHEPLHPNLKRTSCRAPNSPMRQPDPRAPKHPSHDQHHHATKQTPWHRPD